MDPTGLKMLLHTTWAGTKVITVCELVIGEVDVFSRLAVLPAWGDQNKTV
jgi:hypothetical protein